MFIHLLFTFVLSFNTPCPRVAAIWMISSLYFGLGRQGESLIFKGDLKKNNISHTDKAMGGREAQGEGVVEGGGV